MDAIHTQRWRCCDRSWLVSMVTIVFQWHLRLCRNAVNQRRYAVNGLSLTPFAAHTAFMLTLVKTTLLLAAFLFWVVPDAEVPQYTSAGELQRPEHYREWVYLTSGFDMSYNPPMQMEGHHMFDNVFVNPAAYQTFLKTGTWPDHTILVLEEREGRGKGSINQSGNYQGALRGLEVHVKDEARFPGKWAFFG